jgi:hypothetical protein
MKLFPILLLILLISCSSNRKSENWESENAKTIEHEIAGFHQALKRIYNGTPLSTDSLMDSFFDKDVYYVTYWGLSEPIDSTKSRLRHVVSKIKDYESRLEGVTIKVYGEGAYAFFILRQTYSINGILMDEYLPTTYVLEYKNNKWVVVHSQRSADFQTTQHLIEISRQREEPAHSENK